MRGLGRFVLAFALAAGIYVPSVATQSASAAEEDESPVESVTAPIYRIVPVDVGPNEDLTDLNKLMMDRLHQSPFDSTQSVVDDVRSGHTPVVRRFSLPPGRLSELRGGPQSPQTRAYPRLSPGACRWSKVGPLSPQRMGTGRRNARHGSPKPSLEMGGAVVR